MTAGIIPAVVVWTEEQLVAALVLPIVWASAGGWEQR